MGKRAKPVLIIQHAPHDHAAALFRALESQGIPNSWIQVYRGDPYPRANEIEGLISLGGPMGANDEAKHPWILQELELLRRCVDLEMPVVGICLGGQMLSRALGGRVEKNACAEVGWYPIELNQAGLRDAVLGAAGPGPTVYHWHGDTFHLPRGAKLLARSKACPRQAYRIGDKAYGFQFHPEADHQLVLEWLGIEGVAREILAEQARHSDKSVQCPEAQRTFALRGELSSLKITAAIGGLFQQKPYNPIRCGVHDRMASLAAKKDRITLEFRNPAGRAHALSGRIMALVTLPAGEFMIFQEDNTLLWPIRLDDLTRFTPERPSDAKQKSRRPPKRSAK